MRKLFVITVLVTTLFMFPGCTEKPMRPDTPVNTSWIAKMAIDSGNYDDFNNLFSEGRKNSISQNKFKELKELSTAGATYTTYQLITFQNGKMILVRMTQEKDSNGNYGIEDIKVVPDGLTDSFKP
jgi:hypothetical protein